MADSRTRKTRRSIRDGLLRLLEQEPLSRITVAELAAEASVSRSTFYSHYPNTQAVFRELVEEFLGQTRSLPAQMRCSVGPSEGNTFAPFCMRLREEGPWRPLISDPLFLSTLLEAMESGPVAAGLEAYRSLGLGEEEARALYRFQMTGCYAVALAHGGREGWEPIQSALDTFIRGGLGALRSR